MSETLNLVERLMCRVRRLQAIGRNSDALRGLRSLARLESLPPDLAEEVHARLATLRMARGQTKRARHHLMVALAFNPTCVRYHVELAIAYEHDGHARRAIRHYRQALHRDADQPHALIALGRLLTRQGQIAEGTRLLNQAAELRPDDPAVLAELADVLADDAADLSAAIAVLRAARFRHPRDARVQQIWFNFQFRRAAAAQQSEQQEEAVILRAPVILPFIRPMREERPAAQVGGVLRFDRASRPSSHLPGARQSDPRLAP